MDWVIGIIGSIIAGGIVGLLARAIVPGKQDLSIMMTVGLGIVGMLLGQIVGRLITPDNEGVPWIAGVLCAVVVLFGLAKTGYLSKFARSA